MGQSHEGVDKEHRPCLQLQKDGQGIRLEVLPGRSEIGQRDKAVNERSQTARSERSANEPNQGKWSSILGSSVLIILNTLQRAVPPQLTPDEIFTDLI